MSSLEWTVDFEAADGSRHVGRFANKEGEEREMVVTPADLGGRTWFGLVESDPDILDQGDQDVYFSEVNAAKEYAQKLVDVYFGRCPCNEASVFFDPAAEPRACA